MFQRYLPAALAAALILAACGGEHASGSAGARVAQQSQLRAQSGDSVELAGYRSNYRLSGHADRTVTLVRLLDNDTRQLGAGILTIRFIDLTVSFDSAGLPGQAYRLYQAAFNRQPDLGGLGFWIGAMQGGLALDAVAAQFHDSAEFQASYGKLSDVQFIGLLYNNVLKRTPDQGGQDFWLARMHDGMSRAAVLIQFSESAENKANVAAAIADGIDYLPGASSVNGALQSFNPPAAPAPLPLAVPATTLADVIGNYQRLPTENSYHSGKIALRPGSTSLLAWTNAAGLTWTLTPDLAKGVLRTDSSNPYQGSSPDFPLIYVDGKVAGFTFQNEFYARDGVALPAVVPGQPVQHNYGLHGYIHHEQETAPASFSAGFSHYVAMWPLLDQPIGGFQAGLGYWIVPDNRDASAALLPPDNKIRLSTPGAGPTWASLFQTIEGGQGFWGTTQFRSRDPKFAIIGTPDGYEHGMGSPGWGFSPEPLARSLMSIAQLSNRVLTPPDGFTLRKGTAGEFLGYAWMALPLTDQRQSVVAVGDQSWTLFFNASNFAGPVAFWVPDAWTRLSASWPAAAGRGLDTRPGQTFNAAMEVNSVPYYQSADSAGTTYLRSPRVLFPVDAQGMTWFAADRSNYSSAALFEPVRAWFAGGAPASGSFARAATYRPALTGAGLSLSFGEANLAVRDLDKYVKAVAVATPGGGSAWGLQWTGAGTPGVLPEYFRQSAGAVSAIGAAEVPAATNLASTAFAGVDGTRLPYTAPASGDSSWFSPAPAAGPFSATLSDGSRVTYYWYRFIDQPSLQGFGWSAAEKARLQGRIELLHRGWAGTREFMAPPSAGMLATLDAALLVQPPAGMEAGYVPVVTRQEWAAP